MLQQLHKYKSQNIKGWLLSEKMDGERVFWDGGISRGLPKEQVPWANCEKDSRLKAQQFSTGLWTRLGNVVHAPDEWVAELPNFPIDGELWMGYEHRQELMSTIKRHEPNRKDWDRVYLHAFDMPDWETLGHKDWVRHELDRGQHVEYSSPSRMAYTLVQRVLSAKCAPYSRVKIAKQIPLTMDNHVDYLNTFTKHVIEAGGEGAVVRNPYAYYETSGDTGRRSHNILKIKPRDDAEATVIGWTAGKGKYLGMMGSLELDFDGVPLSLSGFTNRERELEGLAADWAFNNPGKVCDEEHCCSFAIGMKVSFKYRGLTRDGVPMEAAYWRKREDD